MCKVFKSDFDERIRFCSNTAYQLKYPVEMVNLAHSGFLGMSRIRYINQIETISKLKLQYIFKASVLDLAGNLNVEVAYVDGFVYQRKSKLKIFVKLLYYQKSLGSSTPGKF